MDLTELLEQAVREGVIECPNDGTSIEPDAEKCPECGWVNPLREHGMI